MDTMTRTLVIEESARPNLLHMEQHMSRVRSVWQRHRPEYVAKQAESLHLVLLRIMGYGGTLSRDGQMGLWLQSGMGIAVVPHTQLLADWAPDDMPSVGAYADGTPYLGLVCWTTVWLPDGTRGDYCLAPVQKGHRTCEHKETPVIMGTPMPVEWSMHS
jgi:hypothetical protein